MRAGKSVRHVLSATVVLRCGVDEMRDTGGDEEEAEKRAQKGLT
jgi:hypothetical protein